MLNMHLKILMLNLKTDKGGFSLPISYTTFQSLTKPSIIYNLILCMFIEKYISQLYIAAELDSSFLSRVGPLRLNVGLVILPIFAPSSSSTMPSLCLPPPGTPLPPSLPWMTSQDCLSNRPRLHLFIIKSIWIIVSFCLNWIYLQTIMGLKKRDLRATS